MKKILTIFILSGVIISQTLDINSLRNMQNRITSSSKNSNIDQEIKQQKDSNILEIPIDQDKYIVGPGDVFRMNIISSDDISLHSLTVSPTGNILIPSLGLVKVNGLSLKSAIKVQRNKVYKLNPTAQVHIQLSEMREFKIKVIGQLQNPGYYNVTSVSRVSDVYHKMIDNNQKNNTDKKHTKDASGFLSTEGAENNIQKNDLIKYPRLSKRNIILIRGNDSTTVDLSAFGSDGNNENNPLIHQGDILFIPLLEHTVGIFGGVKIPGDYEFKKNETLFKIIRLSGGLRPDADPNKIEITRFTTAKEKNTFLTNLSESKNLILNPEDHIMVRYEKDYKRQEIVNISGEVNYPGLYAIDAGKTKIGDILEKAGGYTNRADKKKIFINNKSISIIPDREKNRILIIPEQNRSAEEKAYIKARMLTKKGTIESTSLKHTNSLLNLNITKNDEIIIPENFDFIEVLGAVLKPGRYPYKENISFSKYIDLAGGVTKTATKKKFIIKAGTGQRLRYNRNVSIENGDTIFIPEQIEYNKWIVFKDILTTLGNAAALIVVIQNAIGNN